MIAFSGVTQSHGRNIYIMNDDGGNLHPISIILTRVGVYPTIALGPVWSPDGKFLLFTLLDSQLPTSTLYITNINQGDMQTVAAQSEFSSGLNWLADGRIICSSNSRNSGQMVYSIFPDGSHQQLFGRYGDYIEHIIAPGGEYLAKLDRRDSSILVQDLRDLQEHVLVEKSSSKRQNIQWSPDGSRIAFKEAKGFSLKEYLYIVERDGSNLHAVGRIASESGFAWAPNGDMIAGTSPHLKAHKRSFTVDIITIDAPKQYPISVAIKNPESGDFSPTTPAWSPDGRHLAYSTYGNQFENINIISLGDKTQRCLVADDAKLTSISSITWTS